MSAYNQPRGVKVRGIVNINNTCYLNAAVQCLFATALVRKAVMESVVVDGHAVSRPLTVALKTVFEDLSSTDASPYTPKFLVDTVKTSWKDYEEGRQEDCQEFLSFVLGCIHKECLDRKLVLMPILPGETSSHLYAVDMWRRSERSKVGEVFHLQSVRSSVCTKEGCTFKSVTIDDPMTVISVYPTSTAKCTLKDCLISYCKEQVQSDFECPKCKTKDCVKTGVKFGRLPPVLIIHISRFDRHDAANFLKNSALVAYEHDLDLAPFTVAGLQSNLKYELKAVANHHGNILRCGHYTAFCKQANRWVRLDDVNVSSITPGRAITDNAYLLWYELKVEQSGTLPFDQRTKDLLKHTKFPDYEELTPAEVLQLSRQPSPSASLSSPSPASLPPPLPSLPEKNIVKLPAPQKIIILPQPKNKVSLPKRTTEMPQLPQAKKKKIAVGTEVTSSDGAQQISIPAINALSLAKLVTPSAQNLKPGPDGDVVPQPCKHPAFDLDIEDPILTEADIKGAALDLSNLESARIPALERWLKCRRLSIAGNRRKLIDRIKDHVGMKKASKLHVGVDSGEVHRRKRTQVAAQPVAGDPLPLIPTGIKVWQPFPSVRIPHFTYFKMVEYYEDIPSVDFNYQEGVIKGPQSVPILHEDSELEDDMDEDEATDFDATAVRHTTFQELCRRAVKKCIEKGENFLNSGRVLKVWDVKRGEHYFMKAEVHASMMQTVYKVHIILEDSTGNICSAHCGCKTQALRRCGHIAAVMILLWRHISIEGFEAVTTTGRPCYWKTGGQGTDPSFVNQKQYSSLRRDVTRRNTWDPRASAFTDNSPMPLEKMKKLKKNLTDNTPSCLLLHHIEGLLDEKLFEDDAVGLYDDLQKAAEECSRLMWTLNKMCEGKTEPFEVPNTRGQSQDEEWNAARSILGTASDCKTFLGLSSTAAKINYLRRKVWRIRGEPTAAMKYGLQMEAPARLQYETILKGFHPSFWIEETGLWKNPKYPMLACSPDGFIRSEIEVMGVVLLEIKVIFRTDVDPAKFEEHLTRDERTRFYLRRNAAQGNLELKENHSYYYQIQMALDILELEWCHLYVYSESGYALVPVKRDIAFWNEKRIRLIQQHRELIIPEKVLKRTLRHLPPYSFMFSEFHENPSDDFFLSED